MSTYHGRRISLTITGASHAPEIAVEIHGLREGTRINEEELRAFMKRRAPGQNKLSTSRKEPDIPVFNAGVDEDGVVRGPVVSAVIVNTDTRSGDYSELKIHPRPGHADYTAEVKYKGNQDYAGGGKFSGRMTAPLCIAGGICLQILKEMGIEISARATRIAGIEGDEASMGEAILKAKADGDSVGGVISCEINGMPAGIGGPLFDGIEGELSKMLYAIPAVKGVSFGAGFKAADMLGSENNDPYDVIDGRVVTTTNNAGGILGGISSGMPVTFSVAVKPTPSIAKEQQTVNLETMKRETVRVKGRHDPCIVPRAVPVVEAAAAVVIYDLLLDNEMTQAEQAAATSRDIRISGRDLDEIRRSLDEVDRRLVKDIEERMRLCEEVAEYKKRSGKPIYDARRERSKLLDVSSQSSPEYREYMTALFSLMMQLSRARQGELISGDSGYGHIIDEAIERTPKQFPQTARVACQGVEGAYSQHACDKLFSLAEIEYFSSFEDVFKAVENRECRYGVIPVENSTAGSVNAVYDLMLKYRFKIVRSTRVKIEHCLVAKHGTGIEGIKEIYSHPQAIMQCSDFLSSLENVRVIPCENTAIAAQRVSESGRDDAAALSSESCAELYNLSIVLDGVQNVGNNYTRFICIAPESEIYPGADRTSLMLKVPHFKGSLYNFMAMFYANGINLTKIESRPIPGKDFEFMFYFDLDVSVYEPRLGILLDELSSASPEFEYLGSYREII